MSKSEASWDPSHSPAVFALLACDLAGFKVDDHMPGENVDLPDSDFVLEFHIRPGLKLLLAHESEGSRFVVSSVAYDLGEANQPALLALRMSHHLPPTMRFSVDESGGGNLHLTQALPASALNLETLALAVTDASELMQLLLTPDLLVDNRIGRPEPEYPQFASIVRG